MNSWKYLQKAVLIAIVALLTSFSSVYATHDDSPTLKDGDYLLNLVTKQTSLGRYAPSDLASLESLGYADRQVRQVVFSDLQNMMNETREQGIPLTIVSAYRSYNYQVNLFNRYVSQYGASEAERFSARPGHSEHQLGTAVDFGSPNSDDDLTVRFGQTPQGQWLAENAWQYGFALSYPRGQESVTGYVYEPWHWRYIGKDAAREWNEANLPLNKFLESKPQYYVGSTQDPKQPNNAQPPADEPSSDNEGSAQQDEPIKDGLKGDVVQTKPDNNIRWVIPLVAFVIIFVASVLISRKLQ